MKHIFHVDLRRSNWLLVVARKNRQRGARPYLLYNNVVSTYDINTIDLKKKYFYLIPD